MLRKPYLILLALLITTVACNEKDVYKVPTDVELVMGIQFDPQDNPRFEAGSVVIESFEFEGRREVGDDVEFEKEYVPGLTIQLDSQDLIDALGYTVPQGNYSRIELRIDLAPEVSPNLVVRGWYQRLDNTLVPLVFQFDESFEFRFRMRDESGNTTIPLSEGRKQTCTLLLNASNWFASVPRSLLEQAQTETLDNKETIVVSDRMNENIFELVVSRLDQGNDCRIRFE